MLKYAVALALLIGATLAALYYLGYRMPLRTTPNQPMQPAADYEVEEVAGGLEVPWSIVFTSPARPVRDSVSNGARLLVSERPGRIRVIEDGRLLETPLHVFPEVVSQAEEGLMSLALHPRYADNKLVYAVYAYQAGRGLRDRVVRFRDDGTSVSQMTTILDGIPAAQYHAGSRLKFGPDGKLYITTGDATERDIAQDIGNLGGKILRVNDDGTIPADNPFPNSPVWSYGHRNPQGIDWDSRGTLYETEHGPSGFDGPGGGDEVNRIIRGGNYGWPLVSHERARDGTIAPLAVYTPAEAPASALVYSGKLFAPFKDNLFFGALRGEGIWRLEFSSSGTVRSEEKILTQYGRIREVAESPEGYIYFSTSNRDGRGDPAASDDRIFRLVPKRVQ